MNGVEQRKGMQITFNAIRTKKMYFSKLTELKSVIIRSLSMVNDQWP